MFLVTHVTCRVTRRMYKKPCLNHELLPFKPVTNQAELIGQVDPEGKIEHTTTCSEDIATMYPFMASRSSVHSSHLGNAMSSLPAASRLPYCKCLPMQQRAVADLLGGGSHSRSTWPSPHLAPAHHTSPSSHPAQALSGTESHK
jgi:hypothetical protein